MVALPVVFAAPACDSPPASDPRVEASDSAGVRIVFSRRPAWGEGEAWTVRPEPTLTIGALEGPEEYQLVDVADAARQSDGDVVVADRGSRTVRLYDSRGALVRDLGGPGSGPGEFQDPGPVLVTAGDSVAVWDGQMMRLTRYGASGELADVQTLDLAPISRAIEPPLFPGGVSPLADGGFLVHLMEKSKHIPSGTFRPTSGVLRVTRDLAVIDTLALFGGEEQIAVDAPFGRIPTSRSPEARASGTADAVPPAQDASVSDAAWLTGCWVARSANGQTEEMWSRPLGGTMIGLSRTVRDGSTTGYEFLLLRSGAEGRLVYSAHPSGQTPTDFAVTHLTTSTLRVEKPDHDFPRRIEYIRSASDSVVARVYAEIESESPAFSLRYGRSRCAGHETEVPGD